MQLATKRASLTFKEAVAINRHREALALALRGVGCRVFAEPLYHITGPGPLTATGIGATWHRWNRFPPRVRAVAPDGQVVVVLRAKGLSIAEAKRYVVEKGFELPPAEVEATMNLTNLWVGLYPHDGGPLHRVVVDDVKARLEAFAGETVLG